MNPKYLICIIYSVFLFGLLISGICAGTIDPKTPDSQYIKYAKDFHCVGKIHGVSIDNIDFYGSCVALNNNTVITAAHIVREMKDARVSINNRTIKISKTIQHPLFDKDGKQKDIAICLLEAEIELNWYPELYTNKDESKKICSLAGYGITGTFDSQIRKGDQIRRAGSNQIDKISENLLVCTASSDKSRTSLEFLICYGDSGGGLFIENKLAGIHSSIEHISINGIKQNDYRTTSFHVRISDNIEWINKTIEEISK